MQIGRPRSRLVFFRLCAFWRQSSKSGPTPNVLLNSVLMLLLLCPVAAATYQEITVEALLAFKGAVKNPPILDSWKNQDPCSSRWLGVECAGTPKNRIITSLKLSNKNLTGTISPRLGNLTSLTTLWLDSNFLSGPIPDALGQLVNLTSIRLANNLLNGSIPSSLASIPSLKEVYLSNNRLSGSIPFNESVAQAMRIVVDGNNELCTLTPGFDLPVCGPGLAPALIFGPTTAIPRGSENVHIAAIAGGVAGAVVLVAITIGLVCLCLLRAKSWPSATSDTGSSEPSAQVDWVKGAEQPVVGGVLAPESATLSARQFTLEELEHATKRFSENNKIGHGGFGDVYKGLLEDGTIVAVKRKPGPASQDFQTGVELLARTRHRNLVCVLGFCQENDQQLVVYDYLPNGSLCGHLYDENGVALGKLDFKQRLGIALGAAKGLEHLHTTTPMVVHRDFKTSNVLLDANLVAKVTDFGLSRLLAEGQLLQEGPVLSSTNGDGTAGFLDPEYYTTQRLTERSDVYSFGVFLLELVSGREAISQNRPRAEWSLVEWGRTLLQAGNLGALVDQTLGSNFMEVAMRKMVEVGFHCVEPTGDRRPTMSQVVKELEEALEKERGLAAGVGDGTTTVTLGSELFT